MARPLRRSARISPSTWRWARVNGNGSDSTRRRVRSPGFSSAGPACRWTCSRRSAISSWTVNSSSYTSRRRAACSAAWSGGKWMSRRARSREGSARRFTTSGGNISGVCPASRSSDWCTSARSQCCPTPAVSPYTGTRRPVCRPAGAPASGASAGSSSSSKSGCASCSRPWWRCTRPLAITLRPGRNWFLRYFWLNQTANSTPESSPIETVSRLPPVRVRRSPAVRTSPRMVASVPGRARPMGTVADRSK